MGFRYTVYEDFEKVVAKDKADLYAKVDEGDVDWFSEYDDPDGTLMSQDSEHRNFFNDYRFTEAFSSIKPPPLVAAAPKEEIKEGDQPSLISKTSEKPRDPDYEMKKPKLMLKQSFFDHIQRISKYNNDPTKTDFSKVKIDLADLEQNHKTSFAPAENELSCKFPKIKNMSDPIFRCKCDNGEYESSRQSFVGKYGADLRKIGRNTT